MLTSYSAAGYGIFWTVNATNLRGRELGDIERIRAVWLDVDDPAVDLSPIVAALPPHAIVQSSPGKHHLYWRVDGCSLDEAQPLLRALRMRWGGDAGGTGINRVLRLPGFPHQKGEPSMPVVLHSAPPECRAYTVAEVRDALLPGADLSAAAGPDMTAWTDAEEGGWRNPLTDEQLQAKLNDPAYKVPASAVFGGGGWSLHQLWAPDMHDVEASGRRSEARMSLISHLIYLCGGNCERVYELCTSPPHPLAIKNDRDGLLRTEILNARALFLKWWGPEKAKREKQIQEAREIGASVEAPIISPQLTLDDMLSQFVLVGKDGALVHREGKVVWKLENAARVFAASKAQMLDAKGQTKLQPVLPQWISHPARKTVGMLTWRPGLPEVCAPALSVEGHTEAYNTFRGFRRQAVPENWRDWAAGFLQHVAYLVPVESERKRFLQWLAHIVQHPGELPHTCYLMVTETTGTGRNWLASVLARVFRGYVALGVPLGPILDGKFNGILSEKLLATVDEVREGGSGNRYARGEALKKLITEEFRNLDPKYGVQTVEQNCCRWLIFSNHLDALPFDNNDRRVIVIENPSQRASEAYYAGLYGLLDHPQFIASVWELLRTLSLDGFNPGAPAPLNAVKARAMRAMTPSIDKALHEFAAEWPGQFASARDVRDYVQERTGDAPAARSLGFALARAGWATHPQRATVGGAKESLIGINMSDEQMRVLAPAAIARAIEEARKKYQAT
nr:DUF5906 domain-containing protein [uncultured Roseateles sp.]